MVNIEMCDFNATSPVDGCISFISQKNAAVLCDDIP